MKPMGKKLALQRETVRRLGTESLRRAAGGLTGLRCGGDGGGGTDACASPTDGCAPPASSDCDTSLCATLNPAASHCQGCNGRSGAPAGCSPDAGAY
jgi:hypothetical protein